MQNVTVRKHEDKDLPAMISVWNEVVREGVAFPQEECLTAESGKAFFAAQSFCGVAEEENTSRVQPYSAMTSSSVSVLSRLLR